MIVKTEVKPTDLYKYNKEDLIVVEQLTFVPRLKRFIKLITYYIIAKNARE